MPNTKREKGKAIKGNNLSLEIGTIPLEEKILRRLPPEILFLSLFLALLSLIPFDLLTSLFIFGGGLFSALSFIWLKQAVTKFLIPDKKRALKSAIILYTLRLLLIIIIFFIIIFFFSKKILAFMAGFSTIILVIAVESVVLLFKIRNGKTRT